MRQLGYSILLVASLFGSATRVHAAGGAEGVQSAAPFALLEDYESGAVLYEKNADDPMGPAATVKLLTAEIVFHELQQGRIHLDDKFHVSEYAWRTGGAPARGPAMFLDVRSDVRVEDLMRGLLIESGSDAAITLAEGIAGSEGGFVAMMNKRAEELGMTHSRFANPWGKADSDQRVTARDMAALAAHVIRDYPDYLHYFSEKEFTWNKIHQLNRNPLLNMEIGADGLSLGDNAESGFGLVGTAVQNGQRLIGVINGMKTATERSEEARKLFNWGFRSFDPRVLFQPGDKVGSASVFGGVQSEVPLVAAMPAKIFVPHNSTDRLLAKIVYSGPLVAPVEGGVEVARLKVWRGTVLALDIPLKTQTSVAQGGLGKRSFDAALELVQSLVRRALGKT